ncbi:hypothetical protein REPUB_Repub14bG0135800 [Reevesia pubescens]
MAKSVEKRTLRKGPWSPEEDHKLIAYINSYGIWNWTEMAKPAGLQRSGKSCRLRWMNYLKPGLKHGNFTTEEDETIIELRGRLGNRWSVIASRLPGRTDNEIKNYWHSYLSKRLKYNSMPKSEPFETSIVEFEQKTETEQKTSSEFDLPPVFAPKASTSDSSGAIQLPPQFSTEFIFIKLQPSNRNRKQPNNWFISNIWRTSKYIGAASIYCRRIIHSRSEFWGH